jgi:peptidoglycan/LPS O-acetylase OafA/YrhL
MQSENTFSKIEVISSLRGIASLLVFLFHLICLSNNYISLKILKDIFQYGKHGVDLFFVISGFVICFSMIKSNYQFTNFATFFKKRLIRIEPPYLIALLFTVALAFSRNILTSQQIWGEIDFLQIILHIGYLIPFSDYNWMNIVFWTLAIEFQFYLIISLLFPLIHPLKNFRYLFYALALPLSILMPFDSHIFYWLPLFVIGINLAFRHLEKISSIEFLTTTFLLNLFIFIRYETPIFIFTLIPQIVVNNFPFYKNKVLTFFGEISYSLYLIHTLTGFIIINLGFRLPDNLVIKSLVVLSAILVTIFASYILHKFVEKPFQKIASKINYS